MCCCLMKKKKKRAHLGFQIKMATRKILCVYLLFQFFSQFKCVAFWTSLKLCLLIFLLLLFLNNNKKIYTKTLLHYERNCLSRCWTHIVGPKYWNKKTKLEYRHHDTFRSNELHLILLLFFKVKCKFFHFGSHPSVLHDEISLSNRFI